MARELGLGGSERQLTEIALTLDRDRFSPHVGCFTTGGFRAHDLREAGVPILELGVRSLLSHSALTGAWRMGRYLRRHQIRLVHTFDVPLDLFGVPVARFFHAPVVLSSQRAHRTLTPGATRTLLRLTDRMVDGIVVNSRSVARESSRAEDEVPASLLRLAYNGVDTDLVLPAMDHAPSFPGPTPRWSSASSAPCARRKACSPSSRPSIAYAAPIPAPNS